LNAVEGATYAEIAASGGGIRRRPPDREVGSRCRCGRRYSDWFLRGGTTTIEAKSGYGLSTDAEIKILQAIRRLNADGRLGYVPTFLGAHEVPDEFRGRIDDYVDLVIHEMLPRVAQEKLAEYCASFASQRLSGTGANRAACRRAWVYARTCDQFSADYGSLLAATLTATADIWNHDATAPLPAWASTSASVYSRWTRYRSALHDRSRPAGGAGHRF
jgi:imidazolonepropionase